MRENLLTRLLGVFVVFLVIIENCKAQNLIDVSGWTLGTSPIPPGFSNFGDAAENVRENHLNPQGTSSIMWVAKPDSDSGPSGGFNAYPIPIDHSKAYRFALWIKKTNSNSGTTMLGAWTPGNLNNLSGNTAGSPYFFVSDLPQLNKWYLVVGYVHGSEYTATESYGGIYDGVSGLKVQDFSDFKFKTTATTTGMRAYLNGDNNTTDRQYLYNPRIDQVNGDEPSIDDLLDITEPDGNLLNTDTWTIGCGSTLGFSQNGSTSENCRELGKNHVGKEVVLWKGGNDSSFGPDGGWNTSYYSVDHNDSYRFSVWIKKTNSVSGTTYFGFAADGSGSLRLDGSYNNNPYFWAGDLPKLNQWYLLVGYVRNSAHTGTTSFGEIYDGVTGQSIRTITDYKFKNTVTKARHRAYLYYDNNTANRQFFWAPRIDRLDGSEPSINDLLLVNQGSYLLFGFDTAGNQKQLFYCGDPATCAPPSVLRNEEGIGLQTYAEDPPEKANPDEELNAENLLSIYPNPTNGVVNLKVLEGYLENVHSIHLYNANAVLVKTIRPDSDIELDISDMASGIYFIRVYLNQGKNIIKKVIKN